MGKHIYIYMYITLYVILDGTSLSYSLYIRYVDFVLPYTIVLLILAFRDEYFNPWLMNRHVTRFSGSFPR